MSAITLQFDTAADLESALLDALQNNEGHVSGIAAYLAPSVDSDGGAATQPRQPYAIDGVVYAIARKDQREAYVMFDTPAQANGFVEYMRRFIEKPVPAQTGGEAVAPEAMPVTIFNALDEAAQTILGEETRNNVREWLRRAWHHNVCPAIEAAPPAPPAPLPGKESLTLSPPGNYIQTVPDHCDRIIWRGRYWALPIKSIDTPVSPTLEAAPADYPPLVSKEQLLQDLGYFSPSSARLRDAPEWQRHDRLRRFIEQSGRERVSADPLPLTDTYVQPVPDKCDRITWRGQYYHLPVSSQSQPLVEPTAARVSFLLEQKSVLPHWENLMAYQSEDSARKALPVFRKTTSRDIRIVRQTREVVAVDSVAASPPQHQVKKGEPS